MAVKKTGISRDLIIHPGETIFDILEERGISQADLAASTGVSAAYVSNVIAGKKDISAKFAFALEYALDVPKSFWLNLQANYDAELLELNENQTITEEERTARDEIKDVVKFLRNKGIISKNEKKDESILSLRKALKISNIANLKELIPTGAFRMSSSASINPYVLGAWIRLCQIRGEKQSLDSVFDVKRTDELIYKLKNIMLDRNTDVQKALMEIFAQYGIDFSIVKNFRGAPVQGYVSLKTDGYLQMVITLRNSYADIFWFSVFHELGHIVNGDISRQSKFVDYGMDENKEKAANQFARERLIKEPDYQLFVNGHDFSIESIKKFAVSQRVMPYIVIGRLQKERKLSYKLYSEYKLRYKWANE